jgi:purine nucleosidase
MTPKSLVIDTDTASDDAVALLIAARHPDVAIRAVTTVAGNVPLPLATHNAIVTLDMAGAPPVPVHAGLDAPLVRTLQTAQDVHGADGMGGVGAALPAPSRPASAGHAVDALRRIVDEEPGQHTLVTLGPLSNIATAILLEPQLLEGFVAVYCMAGAFDGVGNVDLVGEFNVWADPEAAQIVLDAPGNKTFVGWDMSWRYAVVSAAEQAELRAAGPLGAFVVDINAAVDAFCHSITGLDGFDLPDPITMAVAIDPSVARATAPAHVRVGMDAITRGGTLVDRRPVAPPPNCTIVTEADEAAFKRMLFAAVASDG